MQAMLQDYRKPSNFGIALRLHGNRNHMDIEVTEACKNLTTFIGFSLEWHKQLYLL